MISCLHQITLEKDLIEFSRGGTEHGVYIITLSTLVPDKFQVSRMPLLQQLNLIQTQNQGSHLTTSLQTLGLWY